MKIEIIHCECGNCGSCYDMPWLGDNSYGEFLLWSMNGEVAYLNAFTDKTYDEVYDLLEKENFILTDDEAQRTSFLQKIYGRLACDPDTKGMSFSMVDNDFCKRCGDKVLIKCKEQKPPKIKDLDIKNVTHKKWESLSHSEKKDFLFNLINDK